MTEYRFVGTHTEDLADGSSVEPGATVELSKDGAKEPHNKRLLDAGLLVELTGDLDAKAVRRAERKQDRERERLADNDKMEG